MGLAARRSSISRDEAEGVGSIPTETVGLEALRQSDGGSNASGGEGSIPSRTDRLYAITRADLTVGMRAAQAGHALIAWVLKHGEPCENLVVLQVPHRLALEDLARRLRGRVELFHEPDLDGQLTAIAAGPECWREVGSVGLMR